MSELFSNGHTPTIGREWRAAYETGVPKRLLSGLVVVLRPVDILTLAMSGELPDSLTPLVAEMMYDPRNEAGEPLDAIERVVGIRRKHMPVIDAICRAALLSPRIVDNPQADDEISLSSLEVFDRVQIFNMVTQGATALQRFRDEPQTDVADLPDGGEVRAETEQLVSPSSE